MQKKNYYLKFEAELEKIAKDGAVPTLLLHSCCAPCSTHVLTVLAQQFHVTIYFYNPNIDTVGEFGRRVAEQFRLISKLPVKHEIGFIEDTSGREVYADMVRGKEDEREGGGRCALCFHQRLQKTAEKAQELGFDYFTTTLSVSPHKNEQVLNSIGESISHKIGIPYLFSDFKKKGGYQNSVKLSAQYGLYRQDYCGCAASKRERDTRAQKSEEKKE